MPRYLLSLLMCLPMLAQAEFAAAEEVSLQDTKQLIVNGSVQVRLTHGTESRIEFDGADISLAQNNNTVTLSATTATIVLVVLSDLESLVVQDGQLIIKVDGYQRVTLGSIAAPEVRLQLMGQGRFDAGRLTTEHLQVALEGQGKASLRHVEADLFELDMTDHGDMDVAGSARQQEVELSGYAHYDAKAMTSDKATVALDDYAAGLIQAKNLPVVNAAPYTLLSAR
jgi:hypothetical protein